MDDLMLCLIPACVLGVMLGIGGGAFELLCEHYKPLRDWTDKQVEKYMEDKEE